MISRLDEFLFTLQRDDRPFHIISITPPPQIQYGPTCGYYATSFVTTFYHLCNSNYPSLPARKKDTTPKSTNSYRSLGKKAGLSGDGGIWDVNQFKLFLPDHHVDIFSFKNVEEMTDILIFHLNLNKPVIITLDMASHDSMGNIIPGLSGGKHAHYVTVIGYFKPKNSDRIHFIFNSWEKFQFVSEDILFNSSNNLKTSITPINKNRQNKMPETQAVDLSNLRNRCILIYPRHFDEIAHYTKSLNEVLFRKYIEYDVVKLLIKAGASILPKTIKNILTPLRTDMEDYELKVSINSLNLFRMASLKRMCANEINNNDEIVESPFKKTKTEHAALFPMAYYEKHLFTSNFNANTLIAHLLKRLSSKLTIQHFEALAPKLRAQLTKEHSDALIYLIEEEQVEPKEAMKLIASDEAIQFAAILRSQKTANLI